MSDDASTLEMSPPIYRFTGRAVGADRDGYYVVRWDRAQPLSVLAETRAEADRKAFAMLGDHTRRRFAWRVRWDSIDECQPAKEAPDVG